MSDFAQVPKSGGEETAIVKASPLSFYVEGKHFAVRQPTCEERDDAKAIQSAYEALWRARPEIIALENLPPDPGELAGFDAAIEAARAMLESASSPAVKDTLSRRISAITRKRDQWTMADQQATDRALLARDRWLTARLLLNENGGQYFDVDSPSFSEAWEELPLIVKDAARPSIWEALRLVENARFF